jgi:hypothetical protein
VTGGTGASTVTLGAMSVGKAAAEEEAAAATGAGTPMQAARARRLIGTSSGAACSRAAIYAS